MEWTFNIIKDSYTPLFKQISGQFLTWIREGKLQPGDHLPSMNQLAIMLGISRETAKKTYNLLVREKAVVAQRGKGVFVAGKDGSAIKDILVIFDKQSIYNQILLQSMQEKLEGMARFTILLHGQNPDVLEYCLDSSLDRYDYYVVSPHFPMDAVSQERAAKLLSRIPNRKLIMVDNWLQQVQGNYGVVYQDFRNDACTVLTKAKEEMVESGERLRVIVLPQSLYGSFILESVRDFAKSLNIKISVYKTAPKDWEKGDVAIVINSQLDSGLVELARHIYSCKLVPGKDVRIISYNEFPLNELVLGGLTVISTDFRQMGRTAAEMIITGTLSKIHNPFTMIRRKSF